MEQFKLARSVLDEQGLIKKKYCRDCRGVFDHYLCESVRTLLGSLMEWE